MLRFKFPSVLFFGHDSFDQSLYPATHRRAEPTRSLPPLARRATWSNVLKRLTRQWSKEWSRIPGPGPRGARLLIRRRVADSESASPSRPQRLASESARTPLPQNGDPAAGPQSHGCDWLRFKLAARRCAVLEGLASWQRLAERSRPQCAERSRLALTRSRMTRTSLRVGCRARCRRAPGANSTASNPNDPHQIQTLRPDERRGSSRRASGPRPIRRPAILNPGSPSH